MRLCQRARSIAFQLPLSFHSSASTFEWSGLVAEWSQTAVWVEETLIPATLRQSRKAWAPEPVFSSTSHSFIANCGSNCCYPDFSTLSPSFLLLLGLSVALSSAWLAASQVASSNQTDTWAHRTSTASPSYPTSLLSWIFWSWVPLNCFTSSSDACQRPRLPARLSLLSLELKTAAIGYSSTCMIRQIPLLTSKHLTLQSHHLLSWRGCVRLNPLQSWTWS